MHSARSRVSLDGDTTAPRSMILNCLFRTPDPNCLQARELKLSPRQSVSFEVSATCLVTAPSVQLLRVTRSCFPTKAKPVR